MLGKRSTTELRSGSRYAEATLRRPSSSESGDDALALGEMERGGRGRAGDPA